MKKTRLALTVWCAAVSHHAFAGSGCGYFNVSLQNYTGTTCVLLSAATHSGAIVGGIVPQYIANGELTPSFQMQQGYFSGPEVRLDYQCGDRSVTLTSKQNYCFWQAGDVSGDVFTNYAIHVKYIPTNGSYWNSRPGQILWTIF